MHVIVVEELGGVPGGTVQGPGVDALRDVRPQGRVRHADVIGAETDPERQRQPDETTDHCALKPETLIVPASRHIHTEHQLVFVPN